MNVSAYFPLARGPETLRPPIRKIKLEGRPGLVEELSESLASRRLARKVVLDGHHHQGPREERLAERIAANVRGLFSVR